MNDSQLMGRVWAFVLYPESCSFNYVNMVRRLECLGLPMAISPLHIPSKNPVPENEKKEHYHIEFYLDGQKKEKDLRKLIDYDTSKYNRKYFDWQLLVDKNKKSKKVAVYPYFLKVNSISCYFRYLLHLDTPSKQQFNDYKIVNWVNDDEQKYNHLVLLNGFNPKDYLKNNLSNPNFQLLDIVKEWEFKKISELMNYLRKNNNIFLTNYIQKNWGFIKGCLLSELFYTENNSKY